MSGIEKRINKWLTTFIIGGTLIGIGTWGSTPKGKKFLKKVLTFLQSGVQELKKNIK